MIGCSIKVVDGVVLSSYMVLVWFSLKELDRVLILIFLFNKKSDRAFAVHVEKKYGRKWY